MRTRLGPTSNVPKRYENEDGEYAGMIMSGSCPMSIDVDAELGFTLVLETGYS